MTTVDYRLLSRHLLESVNHTRELPDGTKITVECSGARRGQLDCSVVASLNGDNLAYISFSVFDGIVGSVNIKDWRNAGEGGDNTLIAEMMITFQQEFPKQELPFIRTHPAYQLLHVISVPNYPLITKIKRVEELKAKIAHATDNVDEINKAAHGTERERHSLSQYWDRINAAHDELRELTRSLMIDDINANESMKGLRPMIRIIKGFKKGAH